MLLLTLALIGCSNCPDGQTFDIDDHRALLTSEETSALHDAYARVRALMPADDVCLSGARIREGEDSSLRGRRLLLGADDPDVEHTMRWGMCQVMADERRYNDGSLEWFEADGGHTFETICNLGPPDVAWIDTVQAACDGADELDDRDRFMFEEVYPGADRGRVDGDVPVGIGAQVVLDDLIPPGRYGYQFAQAGEHLLFLLEPSGVEDHEPSETAQLLRIDPTDGSWAVIWEGLWSEDHRGELVSGAEVGALYVEDRAGEGSTIVVVDHTGAIATVTTGHVLDYLSQSPTAISPERLWSGPYYPSMGPLRSIDLSTGAYQEVPMPDLEHEQPELLVTSMVATSDGVVVKLMDASVHSSGHTTSIGVGQYIHARYTTDSERWEELTRDLHLFDAGLYEDRYLIGAVYSEAGHAVAAYDLEEDALFISDDACLTDIGAPFIAAGDTVYGARYSGDGEDTSYTLTPLTLSPGG